MVWKPSLDCEDLQQCAKIKSRPCPENNHQGHHSSNPRRELRRVLTTYIVDSSRCGNSSWTYQKPATYVTLETNTDYRMKSPLTPYTGTPQITQEHVYPVLPDQHISSSMSIFLRGQQDEMPSSLRGMLPRLLIKP